MPYCGWPVILPRKRAPSRGTWRTRGMGNHTAMPKMLKKRWQRATCHASTGLEVTTVAAMMPVRVVPMLAPRVRGSMSSRVMRPTAARGVRVEVVMEEDCTRMVMPMPITMLRYPLKPTTARSMRAAGPFTMIWRKYTTQKRQEQRETRERMVRNVPAPSSVMSHLSWMRPPLRRRFSQRPRSTSGHTAYTVLGARLAAVMRMAPSVSLTTGATLVQSSPVGQA